VKTIILNNQHLGMVVQWEDRFYESNRGHTFIGDPDGTEAVYPDFVTVAEGFRVKAERVFHKKDLPAAYERMIAHDGPYLLDVIVPNQEHVLPMIPSGMTFDDIITE
ncbi:MAG: acetolactate synthase large subunit, partial [Candidatus Latescibacteria bacterium]|nr:acetolactate synthase large subunit [Candidatus Latescibacterota bacterium]